MICYLFRFVYENKTLISGIAYNLDKIYRKNNPLYCDDKNALSQMCSDLDINFYLTKLEYADFSDENEAKKCHEQINNGESVDLNWKEYVSKTIRFDKNQYVRFLRNRLEALRKINRYDRPLHQFLIDNFNTSENYVYFEERYSKPSGWEMMDKKSRKKYIERFLHLDKKYALAPNFLIKVFSGYDLEETDDDIVIKYKINSGKIPYIVSSMYGAIISTSHTINQLGNKVPIDKSELPLYYALKPLNMYYTSEQYEKDFFNKNRS